MPPVHTNQPPGLSAAGEVRAAFKRDLAAAAARSSFVVLVLTLGGQLVQRMGGGDGHVAALRASLSLGLLLSIVYVRLGRGRSPLALAFWPEAAALTLLALLGLLWHDASASVYTLVSGAAIALGALVMPVLSTVYGLVYPEPRRARLVAWSRTVYGGTTVLAGFLFGRLLAVDPDSQRWLFPLVAALGLVLVARFARMPVAVPRLPERDQGPSAWQVLRGDRMFRRFQLFQFLLGLANLSAFPVIDVYVRRELGLGVDMAVLVVGQGVVMQGVILLSVRQHSRLYDKLGVVWHRVLTSSLIGCSLVVWAVADNLPLAVLACVLAGLGMSGGQIIWLIGSLAFAERERLSTYASIHTFLTGVRGVLAPLLGVWLLNTPLLAGNYQLFFLAAASLTGLSALGHALLVKTPRRA